MLSHRLKSDLSAEVLQSEQSLYEISMTYYDMSLLAFGRHICAPQRDTNMASPYKAL